MLTHLHIRNIALIREASLNFNNGLTTVTGETGAGKSMFIDALSLALGARADISLIRNGESEAIVEAVFEDSSANLQQIFADFGIPPEANNSMNNGEIILRRVISTDKSKAFVNGVRVTQSQLKNIGDNLVDIHGQYDHQLLLKSNSHSGLLDSFGQLEMPAAEVTKTYQNWRKIQDELEQARQAIKHRDEEEFLLRGYLEELEILTPKTGEEEALTQERRQLMSGEKLVEAFVIARDSLTGDIDVEKQISTAANAFAPLVENCGEEVQEVYNRLNSLSVETSDIANEISRLGNVFEPNPTRLAEVDERLFTLKDCARKHNCTADELPQIEKKLAEKLAGLTDLKHNIEELKKRSQEARDLFEKACNILTQKRTETAEILAKSIKVALKKLHMQGTNFQAALHEIPRENWNANGAEKVEFMVATNAGAELAPLVKIASGGEISRLMLALKQVFYAKMPRTTLVFDEVDTGVGGKVADSMGEVMKTLANRHQVFAITHLPQVAAKGDNHLYIEKSSQNNSTITKVTALNNAQRQAEIARMLSGKSITAESRQAAASLLGLQS